MHVIHVLAWKAWCWKETRLLIVFGYQSMHVRHFGAGKAQFWKEKKLFIVAAYRSMHVRHFVAGKAWCWKENRVFSISLCIQDFTWKSPVLEINEASILVFDIGWCM